MKNKQKILIVGGGGREHAVAWKIAQSPYCGELFFAPGNAGTGALGTNIDIKATDINELLAFAKDNNIDLTLALPDDPLALGIVDLFTDADLRIFGPRKNAAELEASKAFSKRFMKKHNLPTAKFEVFSDYEKAKEYIISQNLPIVVKASGLAFGKGVIIAESKDQALRALDDILIRKVFGEAGNEVVIEEFLVGPEISIHAFSDGNNYSIFPASQDHKRVGENDTGLNTGGMGTISPLPIVDKALMKQIEEEIVAPTLKGMKEDGRPFKGILYPGLILTKDGPKILEYNARFGDPETESYMRLLDSDLLEIVNSIIDGNLGSMDIRWRGQTAATIMLASGGYPEKYEKGKEISGIKVAEKLTDIVVFHAGTKIESEKILTNGGRVLAVTAVGNNLKTALSNAYAAVEKISFESMQYRRDIGSKYLN